MGNVMSEETKYKLAHDLGFGEKVEDGDVRLSNVGNKQQRMKQELMVKLSVQEF